MDSLDTSKLVQTIVEKADQLHAEDLTVLRVTEVCDFADFFILMNGNSSTQIKALAEEIQLKCKHSGRPADGIEGMTSADWCLLDFGDVVVHVFSRETRSHYNLEELWKEAPRLTLEQVSALS